MNRISADELEPARVESHELERLAAHAAHRITIRVGDCVLGVNFSDPAWRAGFAARFADLMVDAPASLEHYVVSTQGAYIFWTPQARALAWRDGTLSPNAVVFLADATALSALVNATPGMVSFHAAVVGASGAVGAITGESTAGKTTTAIACARRGLQLYSDERCILQGRMVVPFARTLNIRAESQRLLVEEAVMGERIEPDFTSAGTTDEGVSIPISRLFGGAAPPQPRPLSAVFVLDGRGDAPVVEPVTWQAAARALARWMDCAEAGIDRAARLMHALAGVACFRLVAGSPDATAHAVRSVLQSETMLAG